MLHRDARLSAEDCLHRDLPNELQEASRLVPAPRVRSSSVAQVFKPNRLLLRDPITSLQYNWNRLGFRPLCLHGRR
jgi:hypothetical protein